MILNRLGGVGSKTGRSSANARSSEIIFERIKPTMLLHDSQNPKADFVKLLSGERLNDSKEVYNP